MQVTAKQETERKEIFAYLSMHQPFFAHLLYQQLKWAWTDNVPTAGTDGKNLWFNPEFWSILTPPERVFVLAHEIMHCVLMHPWRRAGRDPDGWNVAGDLVINDCLVKSKVGTMPKQGLIHPKITFDQWTAEKVYEHLPKRGGGGGGGGGDDSGGDKKGREKKTGKPGQGSGSGKDPIDLPSDAKPLDTLTDGQDVESLGKGEETQWQIATAAAKEVAKMQGNMPGDLETLVNEVLAASVNWKERLREWVQVATDGRDRRTYLRPNRRLEGMDVLFPGWYGETVGTIVVALDTSGSIGVDEWAQFKGEVRSILEEIKPRRTVFIFCDAIVQMVEEVEEGTSNYEPRFVGRGGTSFKPPFKWVDENGIFPDGFIYLTDGYGDFPAVPGYPVFWGITSNIQAPWGTTVHVRITTKQ